MYIFYAMSLSATLAQAYDGLFPLSMASLRFLEALATPSGARQPSVLDAGCATGSLDLALAERGWDVLGIESEAEMVEIARSKAERTGLATARFVQGDMLDAPKLAAPRSFDLVLCLGNTLPHLSREGTQRFFSIARSLLLPEGSLILQTLNYSKPGVGPGFAFPKLEAGGLRFSRRYEAGGGGLLRFVAALSAPGEAPGDEAASEAGRRVGEVLLTPLEPAWIADALVDAGFAPPSFISGWEGGSFDADRDLYLICLARPA
jgi:SAM-dependent methyltransferase